MNSGKNGGLSPHNYDHRELAKHFAPKVCTGGMLRSPEFFAQPHLKVRPANITERMADLRVGGRIGKACAGLKHKYRASGAEVRRAFKDGRFEGRVLRALNWAFPGMREDQVVSFMGICGLSIHEVAEGFRALFGDGALDYADYFNHLAEGWTERLNEVRSYSPPQDDEVGLFLDEGELLGGMAPDELFRVLPGDRRWTAIPDENLVIISLGCLHYHLNPVELRRAQQAHRTSAPIQQAMPAGAD